MNRPYVVCHILSALDGAITGSFMSMPETAEAARHYGEIRKIFNCNATLYGTTTMLDFNDGYVENLPKGEPLPRIDYISPSANKEYIIAVDRKGRLAYSSNVLNRRGVCSHIIEILTEQVSDEYLNYLRKLDISYVFAGEKELDCEAAMIKLKEKLGIERLMIAGGGYIDWAFADAGVIDELSLVLAPAADGEDKVTVFEKESLSAKNSAIGFSLKSVEKLDGDTVWLRYKVNNTKN